MFLHKRSVHECVYYECEECGRRFGNKSNVRTHFKAVHEEKKPYKCAKCGRQFARNTNLTMHIKIVHDKISSVSTVRRALAKLVPRRDTWRWFTPTSASPAPGKAAPTKPTLRPN